MAALLLALAGAIAVRASIEDPSISHTPPMGFNDWSRFGCDINQTLFVETADAMVSKGLLAAGYDRINIDDCWPSHERAANGSLQWNQTLFPDGLIWLGQYLHERGFHFGIYEDAGNATCGGYPGTWGHEEQDAKTFESWGVDYLKLDGCNVYPSIESEYQDIYSHWHEVLTGLEQPLIFSESAPAYFCCTDNLTDWYEVMDWVPLYGELARHSTDIAVYGLYEPSHYWESIMTNYGYEVLVARYQQPGYVNDPDFLIVDWPWLTLDEKRSHFALWASFSAPLIISSYIPDLTDAEVEYLTNADIIAIDQDPLVQQATLVSQDGTFDVLTKTLVNGDRLLTVLNHGPNTASLTVSTERMGLAQGTNHTAQDLWTGDSQVIHGSLSITLRTHATAIYRLSGLNRPAIPTGQIFNTASLDCLTASGTIVGFSNCTGMDEQVWQISSSGTISPLPSKDTCLQTTASGSAALDTCNERDSKAQQWTYYVTGTLVNAENGKCLKETVRGGAHLVSCGCERDGQVFALPVGVEVVRGKTA